MPLELPPPLGTPFRPATTLDGRVAIVTGGGTGLGLGIAKELSRAGATIAIVSRSAEHRQRGVEAIVGIGGRAVEAACDLRESDQVHEAFAAVADLVGPPSILVNNAAANFPVLAEAVSPNGWRAIQRTVLDGTFFASQALYAHATGAGIPGAICNIVATQATTGGPGMAPAAAAKAGVENLTKSLAVEWARVGIRVNAVAPGLFPHDDMREDLKALRMTGPEVDARRAPAYRPGDLRELAWAVTYLCSPYAAFITGHTLVVDGANSLRRDFVMPEFTPIAEQLRGVLRPR